MVTATICRLLIYAILVNSVSKPFGICLLPVETCVVEIVEIVIIAGLLWVHLWSSALEVQLLGNHNQEDIAPVNNTP